MIYESRTFRIFVLTLVIAMLWPVGYGAKMAWDLQANRVEDWLPETFAETQRLLWFVERFGSDELLMVSWDGCTFEDPRLREFSNKLQEATIYNGQSVQWFQHVWT
ncbi:MAG: hypothetical protein ACC645_10860, partial [Pirellulales bacterium]